MPNFQVRQDTLLLSQPGGTLAVTFGQTVSLTVNSEVSGLVASGALSQQGADGTYGPSLALSPGYSFQVLTGFGFRGWPDPGGPKTALLPGATISYRARQNLTLQGVMVRAGETALLVPTPEVAQLVTLGALV